MAILLIILSSLVLDIRGKSKSDIYQHSKSEGLTRKNNETKIRALIDIKRLPNTTITIPSNTTTTILVNGDQREKIARKHHHYDDGGM